MAGADRLPPISSRYWWYGVRCVSRPMLMQTARCIPTQLCLQSHHSLGRHGHQFHHPLGHRGHLHGIRIHWDPPTRRPLAPPCTALGLTRRLSCQLLHRMVRSKVPISHHYPSHLNSGNPPTHNDLVLLKITMNLIRRSGHATLPIFPRRS